MNCLFLFLFFQCSVTFSIAKKGHYFAGTKEKNYCEAKLYCKSKGGSLATIRDAYQNKEAENICYKAASEWASINKEEEHGYLPCWLGLTEFVGTPTTPIEHQLWLWADGNASTIPKGSLYKPQRSYTLGYFNEMNHTSVFNASDNTTTLNTITKGNVQGKPLQSFDYQNWAKCSKCSKEDQRSYSEPNNFGGCSESHAFMASGDFEGETYERGKWYDVLAHEYVELLPLCEYTMHSVPIHDHECDSAFAFCWYEQCENEQVGKDSSSCWAKKNGSLPKCSANAVPKYTDLEMFYKSKKEDVGTLYREYTCCDEKDTLGRTKRGFCYEDGGVGNGYIGALLFLLFCCCCGIGVITVCVCMNRYCRHSSKTSQIVQHQSGSIQMINMGQYQSPQSASVIVPHGAVPGSIMLVNLPNGTSMHVTVPNGAVPGSVLNVECGGSGSGSGSVLQPQNRNVPELPAHNWNDKLSSQPIHVTPIGTSSSGISNNGGGGSGFSSEQRATPFVISEPIIISQQHQQQQPVAVFQSVQ
jgi:hypothetical protein